MPDDLAPILLIDARNLMYRAIFANKQSLKRGNQAIKAHHFTVMVRFMYQWLDKFRPSSVNIFWDAPKSSLWRRQVYAEYKDRDDSEYHVNIKEDLVETQNIAKDLYTVMGVRQFDRDKQEADDLIYAACKVLFPRPVVIVSSDADYLQVVYRMGNVKLYDHCKDKFLESSDFDPVIQKALSGDKSDRIEGYYKIGPVNGAKLARCLSKRHDFLRDKGRSVFIRNTLLVDLSLCPHLLKNELYVHRVLATDLKYDKKQIQELSLQHRVSGLVEEYQRIVLPFKVLTSPAQK